MKFQHAKTILLCLLSAQLAAFTPSSSAQLKAGASRVDITPALGDLPQPFTSIKTPLYARTLVLENGGKRVAIVVGDLPTIATDILADLMKRIGEVAGTSPNNVIMATTHMHSSVRLDNNPVGIMLPGSAKITKITSDEIITGVHQAMANLQPARAGYATGVFHLATNRPPGPQRPAGGLPQREGPTPVDQLFDRPGQSTPKLGVLKVESTSGDLIALLVNGGPEPVMGMASRTTVQADVSGVMERYLEQRFNDKAVVLYTVGTPASLVVNSRQQIPGTVTPDPYALMNAVGTIMGEDALATAMRIKTSADLPLSSSMQTLTCPGKATTPLNNSNSCSDAPGATLPKCVFTDKDTAPVSLRIGLVRIGDLAVIDTDSDINAAVWSQVTGRAPSPENTMLIELNYGPMHYVIPDAEYPTNSYQATASMVKRGCAEKGFVDDSVTLLKSDGAPTGK